MNAGTFISILLIPLALWGCAASEPLEVRYDPATGQSSYESKRMIMGYRDMSAGLVVNQRIMWQALASCSGQDCTPEEVTLVFFNDTSEDLNLDYRRLQLIIDGITYDWQDLDLLLEPGYYTRVPSGEFFRVSLEREVFVQLAKAQEVAVLFGETGTTVVQVPYARRAGFRVFVEELGVE